MLEEIDWSGLTHAYGPADDVPKLLRHATDHLDELWDRLFGQGVVYPATVAAVPFIADLARTAPARRAEFAWMLGMLADPRHASGDSFEAVRAAVTAQPPLPLDDPDPEVRAAAAYVLAQTGGPATALHERAGVEEDPKVRASLMLALGKLDPDGTAGRFAHCRSAEERFAAALAATRAGRPLPAGAAAAVATAISEGIDVDYAWMDGEPADELIVPATDPMATDLVSALTISPDPEIRQAAVFAVSERALRRRSTPALLVPLVAPLLADPDPRVRREVISTLRGCGAAAAPYREEIAAVAARYPEISGSRAITAERQALETLIWLGDPRWVDLAPTARDTRRMTFTPEALDAVRRRLVEHPHLAHVLGSWGHHAADAVPELLAILPRAGRAASLALARIGHHVAEALPHLREPAVEGDLDAAAAIRRLTGDTQPLLDALDAAFRRPSSTRWPAGLDDAGDELRPLVPVAFPHLTGEAAQTHAERMTQILAARLAAATGNTGGALPTLRALVTDDGHHAIGDAAELLADLGGPDERLAERLDELVTREQRLIASGVAADIVWHDEALSERLRAAARRVRQVGSSS
ncbi:hypothetical protein ACFO0M_17640 [Micromonospora mangrovi]|uniref:HEAT repeat domain-containing protein n=2 Tax=Micromonospora TaxID=1873 RepID=A0AAU7MBB1_9ACTN